MELCETQAQTVDYGSASRCSVRGGILADSIGTGKTCESSEANRICGLIRSWVGAPDLIIQYGGSVKPGNIDELMGMSDIDGVLVGGASLDAESFARIANYQVA